MADDEQLCDCCDECDADCDGTCCEACAYQGTEDSDGSRAVQARRLDPAQALRLVKALEAVPAEALIAHVDRQLQELDVLEKSAAISGDDLFLKRSGLLAILQAKSTVDSQSAIRAASLRQLARFGKRARRGLVKAHRKGMRSQVRAGLADAEKTLGELQMLQKYAGAAAVVTREQRPVASPATMLTADLEELATLQKFAESQDPVIAEQARRRILEQLKSTSNGNGHRGGPGPAREGASDGRA